MGEKGNLVPDPVAALDAIPLDLLKGSPETMNAWIDTYLKAREVQEAHQAADAGEPEAGSAAAQPEAGDSPR